MANYFPVGYQPQFVQQPSFNQHQNNNGIVWVQGIEGAKAYPVGAGNSVLLMDSEDSVFYIKTTDASGMPSPLRVFDYSERTENKPPVDLSSYVTRDELEKRIAELKPRKERKNESTVQSTR